MDTGSEDDKRDQVRAKRRASDEKIERKIDRDLEDSFPASDPPGWTLGVERPEKISTSKDEA